MNNELNDIEMACFLYGKYWGALKVFRNLGDRERARAVIPDMRRLRAMCLRRCRKCVHHLFGRCHLRGIKACVDSNAVGCEYYLTKPE